MKRSETERAKIIDPGFSIADAKHPSVSSSDSGLIIRFRDWRDDPIEVLFVDAISYRWDEIDWDLVKGEHSDCTHAIENSEWMAEHLVQNFFSGDDGFAHYRLNFSMGTLEVISRHIESRTEHGEDGKASPATS